MWEVVFTACVVFSLSFYETNWIRRVAGLACNWLSTRIGNRTGKGTFVGLVGTVKF
jgi:hypothetical protein